MNKKHLILNKNIYNSEYKRVVITINIEYNKKIIKLTINSKKNME